MADALDGLIAALADRYTIDVGLDGRPHLLGQGGMASVYLAEDRKHHRQVAVKVLRPELAATLGPERFLREVAIAASLQHPHVLPLFDSGQANGLLYYVMPFVNGQSLREKMATEGKPPISDAVRILRDVADGMAYAHQQGVIHRDIKPENVMLAGRHAVVTDFGIAKAVSEAAGGPQATLTGLALGTPAYMAPEQAMGDPAVDHRADIYAFGVLAYELLSGRAPFLAATAQAMVAAKISRPPEPLAAVSSGVPPALARIVMKCLATDPAARFQSSDELLREIEALQTPSGPLLTGIGWRRLAVAGVAAILLVGALGYVALERLKREHWVREQAIPEIQRLTAAGAFDSAFSLAVRATKMLPKDSALSALWPTFSAKAVFRTLPAGAKVSVTAYRDTSGWETVGITPTDSVRLPFFRSRVRIEKAGFRPMQLAVWHVLPAQPFILDRIDAPDPEMVRVSGGDLGLFMPGFTSIAPIALGDFLIDRYEVTNGQYKAFVTAGGYTKKEYWEHPFLRNGRRLSFEEATAAFVDKTGRPGPATWEAGDLPQGQADLPVSGVSWYEAAAFAKFLGKSLPTVFHWARAAEPTMSGGVVPGSNFNSQGPTRGSTFRGMGPFGTFDMAGNVREWCENAVGEQRYILGGGWSDRTYMFTDAYAQDPFDRSPINGIRLVKYPQQEPNLALARRPLDRAQRDFSAERPVSDAVFESFRQVYDYDHTPLRAQVDARDTTAEGWIREQVSFDAAYGGERMLAYLFLPKPHASPFQTVVVFGGDGDIHERSSAGLVPGETDFFLKSGRAVLWPIYKGTFERGDSLNSGYANGTVFYRDHVVMWAKDLRRSLDYLSTRVEIDSTRFAYYGVSWGGYLGGLMPAVEPRFKAVILVIAGLMMERGRPEVEPLNFLPRITAPVIMLNGRYDHFFPIETAQEPMYRLLGTPPDRKRWVLSERGHNPARTQVIAESLDWLDKYLGPVR